MRYLGNSSLTSSVISSLLFLIFIVSLTACTPKQVTLDDARQIAVNRVMADDNYVQNDGYDLKERMAANLDCENCYAFTYEYKINEDYNPGVSGYTVEVVMKDDVVTSVMFNEIISKNDINGDLPPIADRFDQFCENKCGDGYCNEIVCHDVDCVCEENSDNCPEDCTTQNI